MASEPEKPKAPEDGTASERANEIAARPPATWDDDEGTRWEASAAKEQAEPAAKLASPGVTTTPEPRATPPAPSAPGSSRTVVIAAIALTIVVIVLALTLR